MANYIYREIWLTEDRRIEPIPLSQNSRMHIRLKVMDYTIASGVTITSYIYNGLTGKYTPNNGKHTLLDDNIIDIEPGLNRFLPGHDRIQVHFPIQVDNSKTIITGEFPVKCAPDYSKGGINNPDVIESLTDQSIAAATEAQNAAAAAAAAAADAAAKAAKIPDDLTATLNGKVNVSQGTANKGKALVINDAGNVVPGEAGVQVDTTFTVSGKAADAKAVGDKIAATNANLAAVSGNLESVTGYHGKNKFLGVWEQGFLTGGQPSDRKNALRNLSYIKVEPYNYAAFSYAKRGGGTVSTVYGYVYNANFENIARLNFGVGNSTVSLGSDVFASGAAKYIRFAILFDSDTVATPDMIANAQLEYSDSRDDIPTSYEEPSLYVDKVYGLDELQADVDYIKDNISVDAFAKLSSDFASVTGYYGKNKFSGQWETGSFDGAFNPEDGTTNASKALRSTTFIPIPDDGYMSFCFVPKVTPAAVYAYVYTDAFAKAIRWDLTELYNPPTGVPMNPRIKQYEGKYVKFLIVYPTGTKATPDMVSNTQLEFSANQNSIPTPFEEPSLYVDKVAGFDELRSDVDALKDNIGMDIVPDYWIPHMEEKAAQINALSASIGRTGDAFIFLTDYHVSANNGKSHGLVRYIQKNTSVTKFICGGDIGNGSSASVADATKTLLDWRNLFADCNPIVARGNHDGNPNSGTATDVYVDVDAWYGIYDKYAETITNTEGNEYFCLDNESQKIRYIILDTGDGQHSMADDIAQQNWLKAKLIEKDENWSVLVIAHAYANGAYVGNDISSVISWATPIKNALRDARESMRATMIGVLAGHTHRDFCLIQEDWYLAIGTTCDAGGATASQYDSIAPNRVVGTTTEQAFDVYHIDTKNKRIYATRIGAGFDRVFSYDNTSSSFGKIS